MIAVPFALMALWGALVLDAKLPSVAGTGAANPAAVFVSSPN